MTDKLEAIRAAAGELEHARRLLHVRVLEARSPDLFGRPAASLRAVAEAAGVAVETARKLAATPLETSQ